MNDRDRAAIELIKPRLRRAAREMLDKLMAAGHTEAEAQTVFNRIAPHTLVPLANALLDEARRELRLRRLQ